MRQVIFNTYQNWHILIVHTNLNEIFGRFVNMMVKITMHCDLLDASQDSLDFLIAKTVLAQKKGLYRLYAMKILER